MKILFIDGCVFIIRGIDYGYDGFIEFSLLRNIWV